MTNPRVRIAPSPTGNLHVGTARTALFNYLFAKKTEGKFILRIEDTDLERSKEEYVQNIFDSLKALGLDWDEGPDVGGEYGPYVQSERLNLYKEKAQELVDKGLAYYCYCTQEELEAEKEQARQNKLTDVYSKKCANLSEEQVQQYINEGRKPSLRFRMPEKELIIKDIIRGEVKIDTSLIGDYVILKSNGTPTYNFAVVIDDMGMKISHVIRGEDHISNTPRQIVLFEAFNYPVPEFAHVGMILAPDKSKLSKRHGATAVSEFIENGYMPEAFVNFMALLGWSAPDGEEILALDKIIEAFDLERVSHSAAVFDKDKLNWMNGMYIRDLPIQEAVKRCKKYMSQYDLSRYTDEKIEIMIGAVREPFTVLADVTNAVSYFFNDSIEISEEVKEAALTGDHVKDVLEKFMAFTEEVDLENLEELNERFKDFRKSLKPLKPKFIMMPIRAVLTGQLHGADLNKCLHILGKEAIKKRITSYLNPVSI